MLLNAPLGVDGLKTGHTDSGKYGIALSANKNGRRVILVINGLATEQERAYEATRLLQYGFLNFTNIIVSSGSQAIVEVPVLLGKNKKVKLGTTKEIIFTIPRAFQGQNEVKIEYPSVLYAPVYKEKKVGEITVKLYNGSIYTFDLHPLDHTKKAGTLSRLFTKTKVVVSTFRSFKKVVERRVQTLKL